MFDQGFLGVHPETKELQVSPQLRATFGNGEEFYSRARNTIPLPARVADQPDRSLLQWHLDVIYRH